MNRKKINAVTVTLYFVLLVATIAFAYVEHIVEFKAWIAAIVCFCAMLLVGIIRAIALKADKKKTIETNAIRVVNVAETKVEGDANVSLSVNTKLPLVHVDSVDEKKIVISLHKEKALPTDCVGKIVK